MLFIFFLLTIFLITFKINSLDFSRSKIKQTKLYLNNLNKLNTVPKKNNIDPLVQYNSNNTIELTKLLENMPNEEKYSFIIQSYASKIINEGVKIKTNNKQQSYYNVINKLYNEMIKLNIVPDMKTTQYFIDSSVIFCDCDKLGSTFQLAKSGGLLKVFGAAIGGISNPIFSANVNPVVSMKLPIDNREEEVFYAGMVFSGGFVYTLLQIIASFNEELKPWAGLSSLIIGLAVVLDIFINNTKGLKLSLEGFDRLLLSDSERQSSCDSAALLTGYLLGLPCFCFQPDVGEALKMLANNINTLQVYKQPKAININTNNIKNKNLIDDSITKLVNIDENYYDSNQTYVNSYDITSDVMDLSLGRVLIWMMAPVAVESLKYGKTIHSDPRRPNRLLTVLNNIQSNTLLSLNDKSTYTINKISPDNYYNIPKETKDKQALLDWAYYEAVLLIRRYGDLIEEVKGYMKTGTASVGECVVMIEDELK